MIDLNAALEAGATVLTGSHRLARSLDEAFTVRQRDKGRSVWTSPKIQSLDKFLEACWRQAILLGESGGRTLLNPAQEAALWESVIDDSPSGRTLLRVPETAQRAVDAWKLMHAYRLPFRSGEFAASEDCEAFYAWAAEFDKRMDAHGYLDSARLPDRVAALLRADRIASPRPLLLAGFDDLTPQREQLLAAMPQAVEWQRPKHTAAPQAAGFADSAEELRQAALWSRWLLQTHPGAKIGVVVPSLENLRSKVDRIFREALHPGGDFHPGEAAFHISVGPFLSDRPIVHAALLILERAGGALTSERLGALLRSPFLKGAVEERSARAAYDAVLRRGSKSDSAQAACPRLNKALGALDREVRKLPPEQYASDWGRTFSRLLKMAGWPDGVTQNSAEYQTARAWNDLLSTLASLDAVAGRLSLQTALSKLRKLAETTRSQSENAGSAVEILGLLEASGLEFDHLWVLGLHDEAMPPQARPNPFLPLGLQRRHGLPHSSAERELEFNTKLLARLGSSAPQVTLSYPQWEGDQPLGASPLIARHLAHPPAPIPAPPLWAAEMQARASSESFEDAAAPELPADTSQSGGTWFLRDMAACPFRAYAQYRLGARPLEDPALGIDPRDRGKAVHEALRILWSTLRTQAALCALPAADLDALIRSSVDEALAGQAGLGRTLEKRRITGLLHEWLVIEKARPPFEAVGFEQELAVTFGGLRISTRIDRVDQLPDGRRIIIDYKTGVVKANAWAGDRMDEPQVPLYCASSDRPIAAAAFAQLRAGELQFRGLAENGELGPLKPMNVDRYFRIADLIRTWDTSLHALAGRFRAGEAPVDPKQRTTCDYCKLTALCRIRDSQDLAGSADE